MKETRSQYRKKAREIILRNYDEKSYVSKQVNIINKLLKQDIGATKNDVIG